jgi:NAD(P)-dependent dehydrogenase (short-subunit alcohol dehydrogenase family)
MTSSGHKLTHTRSVLITGTSSGLGRAAATHLCDLGYQVFAGVRTEASAAELSGLPPSAGELIPVLLDVTDAASIARAGDLVEQRCADTGLWAVVNNAGICVSAPLECIPIDVMRAQLETNVIGALAVTQRFLPLLRESGGRVINVSSGIGNVTPPFLGAYAATQFGKEGVSDALRRELRPLGVSVSVIQPGAVDTPIWPKLRTSAEQILAAAPPDVVDVYRGRFTAFRTSASPPAPRPARRSARRRGPQPRATPIPGAVSPVRSTAECRPAGTSTARNPDPCATVATPKIASAHINTPANTGPRPGAQPAA